MILGSNGQSKISFVVVRFGWKFEKKQFERKVRLDSHEVSRKDIMSIHIVLVHAVWLSTWP